MARRQAPPPRRSGGVKNALRIVVYLVIAVAVAWFVMRYLRQSEAIRLQNSAVKLIESGEYDKALDLLGRAEKKGYDDAAALAHIHLHQAMAYLGRAEKRKEATDYAAAIEDFAAAGRASHETAASGGAQREIAACHVALRQWKEGLDAARRALTDNPEDREADLLRKRCERALEAGNLARLAQEAFDRKDWAAAEPLYRKLASDPPLAAAVEDSHPWYRLAVIACENGKGEEAAKALAASELYDRDDPEMKRLHAELKARIKKQFPDVVTEVDPAKAAKLFE